VPILEDFLHVLLWGLFEAVVVGFHLFPQFRHLLVQLGLHKGRHQRLAPRLVYASSLVGVFTYTSSNCN